MSTNHYTKEPTMAGYSVNPGPFKAVAADPEGTLERLEDYCRTMEMVFRLSRRVTSTGTKIDFDDSEKKDMIQIEGGEDMMQLFRFVGKVQDTDATPTSRLSRRSRQL